jgi:hypothetical protein
LAIGSGFPATPGAPDPLPGHPYVLLRDSYANAIARTGLTVPAGMSPFVFLATACANRSPDCQKLVAAINADAAAAVRADASGRWCWMCAMSPHSTERQVKTL